jgi:parallel beta-helix repeat protein
VARFLVCLSLILAVSRLSATSYYVAPNGSNRNPGTLDRPLATITFGISKLNAPGDALVVRGGTYRETVNVWQKNGDSSKPIAIRAQPGEKPVIDGTRTRANAVVTIIESSFVTFDGFEVRNGPHGGILIYDAHHISIRWNNVHDCGTNGIGVVSDKADTAHDVLIEGNIVSRCVLSNAARRTERGWVQAISAYGSDRVTIRKNYVHENYGEGIDYILSDHGTITGNQAWDNYSANIYLDNARYTLVDSNFVTTGWSKNAAQFYRSGAPGAGIAVANEHYEFQRPVDALTITNNIVVGTSSGFGYGAWEHGGGLHHTLVANNTFVRTTGPIITIEPGKHDTSTVANNIFEQRADALPPQAPASGVTFRTNAWHGGKTTIPGEGDVNADPQFVTTHSGTPDDYRLQAMSRLRDAGTPLPAVKNDFAGAPRRGRTIGAFE